MTKFYFLIGLLGCSAFNAAQAAEDKAASEQMRSFVDAVNKGSSDEILKVFDMESLVLLLEPRVIDYVIKSTANATLPLPTGLANVLLSIQGESRSKAWLGMDIGIESTVDARQSKKEIQRIMDRPFPPGASYAFPMDVFIQRTKDEFIDNTSIQIQYVGEQTFKEKKRDNRAPLCIYSHAFGRILCFDTQEGGQPLLQPIDERLVLDIRVIRMGVAMDAEKIFFRKVNGEWKLFGSARGLVPYVPALPEVSDVPFFKDVWIAAQSKGSLLFRLMIKPENKIEVLSFGTKDLSIPLLGPAIFQDSNTTENRKR